MNIQVNENERCVLCKRTVWCLGGPPYYYLLPCGHICCSECKSNDHCPGCLTVAHLTIEVKPVIDLTNSPSPEVIDLTNSPSPEVIDLTNSPSTAMATPRNENEIATPRIVNGPRLGPRREPRQPPTPFRLNFESPTDSIDSARSNPDSDMESSDDDEAERIAQSIIADARSLIIRSYETPNRL